MDVGRYTIFVQVDIVAAFNLHTIIYHLSVIFFNSSIMVNSLHCKPRPRPRLDWLGVEKLGDHHQRPRSGVVDFDLDIHRARLESVRYPNDNRFSYEAIYICARTNCSLQLGIRPV